MNKHHKALDVLRRDPDVAYVEEDSSVHTLEEYVPWGVSKIEAPSVWTSGNNGAGIKIAVLDTGVAANHPDLHVAGGVSFVSGITSWNDDHGHGTHCAGIIAALDDDIGVVGVAPDAELYAVKVLDRSGGGYISSIINGIEWCITNNMQVISMSFGSYLDSSALHAECNKAYNYGIVLVAAAGNSGPGANTVGYPARYSSVISVAATLSNDEVASFSSRGPELSVAAPGVTIYSTYLNGQYVLMSGTSMACPHAAGTAALILENETHTPAEVKNILQETAVDLGAIGPDTAYGHGRINAKAAVEEVLPPSNPLPDFSLSTLSTMVDVKAGSYVSFTTQVTSLYGFHGKVSLDKTAPDDWIVSFSPPSLSLSPGRSTSAATWVTVPSTASSGMYIITVTAFSWSVSHHVTVAVNVKASKQAQTLPSAPLNLAATAGNAKIDLSWSAPSSNGGSAITNYRIYRRVASSVESLIATIGNTLAYTDVTAANGQTYYYRVTAVNSLGESPKSNEASATPSEPTAKMMNVLVTTDKTVYSRGTYGIITITVTDATDGKPLQGVSLSVSFYEPSGSSWRIGVYVTSSSGTKQVGFGFARTIATGTYKVVAIASSAGYQTGVGQALFSII